MIGGQEDVERGHDVVVARRRVVETLALLLECDDVTPVAELNLLVCGRRNGLTEHDEVGEPGRTGVSGRTRRARARVCLTCHGRCDDVALEKRERRDLRGGAGARLRPARRRHARRDGACRHDRAVSGIRESSVERNRVRRRVELARARARLARDDHLDRPGAGDRPRRAISRAGRRREAERAGNGQGGDQQGTAHRLPLWRAYLPSCSRANSRKRSLAASSGPRGSSSAYFGSAAISCATFRTSFVRAS
jgi:hypothetical protein